MELRIFGKELFSARKSRVDQILKDLSNPNSASATSKFLPDFYKSNLNGSGSDLIESAVWLNTLGEVKAVGPKTGRVAKAKKPVVKVEEKPKATPKGVYELKLLNDPAFKLNTNPEYVDAQIEDFKNKLATLEKGDWDMRNGVNECQSVIVRMENRKKYPEHKAFFEEFPYTTTTRINGLLAKEDHNNLQLGTVAQFVADLPKEASDVMKRYNDACMEMCQKQTMFYIIADKKDFKKTEKRRDPILLAQSPFGHVWQILGAWDEEMLLIEEL